MNSSIIFTLLSLLLLLLPLNPTLSSPSNRNRNRNFTDDDSTAYSITRYARYVKNACNVTQYKNLCVRTLWPFAIIAKNNTSVWARASVAVTITDTKQILRRLLRTQKQRSPAIGKRERIALSDCRELFVDSLDNLYKSLNVLRNLNAGGEFQDQMSDLATWLSAALTDEDTCLDGFEEISSNSLTVRMIRRKVTKCMQLCSNALALEAKLAYDGL